MSDIQEMSTEELRRQHEAEFANQKNEETVRRLADWGDASEGATLVVLEKLELAGTKLEPIWLRDGGGPGILEAHENGFRYSTSGPHELVEVMYVNIKHAFFQPARTRKKETVSLLHLHLHNHMMVGNKKSKDVQLYVDRMEMDLQKFVNKVKEVCGLEFEETERKIGFHGVVSPNKEAAFIMPTKSCLVELAVGDPFLVITLSEIEMVNLERTGVGHKDFDMTIVFKDFERDVFRIDSIPNKLLGFIENWFSVDGISYHETRRNLNWKYLLKALRDDPKRCCYGWKFLSTPGVDSDSEETEKSDLAAAHKWEEVMRVVGRIGTEEDDEKYELDPLSDDPYNPFAGFASDDSSASDESWPSSSDESMQD